MNSSSVDTISKSLAKRKPGRPKSNQLQGEELKKHVIAACEIVYSKHGYRDSSVELITKAAGISRPLFYRLFKNRHEVIEVVLAKANEALLNSVTQHMESEVGFLPKISASIDAYFDWCRSYGPIVGHIYNELSDYDSPASKHRKIHIEKTTAVVNSLTTAYKLPALNPMLIDAIINTVEHVGSKSFWPKPLPEDEIKKNRDVVQRMVMATLARPEDASFVPSLDEI